MNSLRFHHSNYSADDFFEITFSFQLTTGSIVEGACLSRIFHPSKTDSLELEADVMYVVGSITEVVAEECFQVSGITH